MEIRKILQVDPHYSRTSKGKDGRLAVVLGWTERELRVNGFLGPGEVLDQDRSEKEFAKRGCCWHVCYDPGTGEYIDEGAPVDYEDFILAWREYSRPAWKLKRGEFRLVRV